MILYESQNNPDLLAVGKFPPFTNPARPRCHAMNNPRAEPIPPRFVHVLALIGIVEMSNVAMRIKIGLALLRVRSPQLDPSDWQIRPTWMSGNWNIGKR